MNRVLLSRGRKSAILISQGPKYWTVVLMKGGLITTTRLTLKQVEDGGWHPVDYPLAAAIAHFLTHPAGVSDAARRELIELTGDTA